MIDKINNYAQSLVGSYIDTVIFAYGNEETMYMLKSHKHYDIEAFNRIFKDKFNERTIKRIAEVIDDKIIPPMSMMHMRYYDKDFKEVGRAEIWERSITSERLAQAKVPFKYAVKWSNTGAKLGSLASEEAFGKNNCSSCGCTIDGNKLI